ncbi:MAG: DUF427 domain-containing protein [Pseudomonadota bacterium]
MPDRIRLRKSAGTWVIRAGGAILGETSRALELSEGERAPVIYFPRADIAMPFFEPSVARTRSPVLGEALHFDIVTPAGTLADAAWSYEHPEPGFEAIAGHVAFRLDRVTLERTAERAL